VSTGDALRRFWASVRPRTRRGWLVGAARIGLLAALFSVAFLVVAASAWSPYAEVTLQPDANPRTWAALQPTYAGGGAATCAGCHEREARRLASRSHENIGCESCHGPLLEHSLASPGTVPAAVRIVVPTAAVCERCHQRAEGRPAAFRQVVPADHYVAECLACHDPHTGISRRPPVVEHTLDNLPPCITCHGPDGFKARNQRHPIVAADDPTCLACHQAGRGATGRVAPNGRGAELR
jgi:cytochrome c553